MLTVAAVLCARQKQGYFERISS